MSGSAQAYIAVHTQKRKDMDCMYIPLVYRRSELDRFADLAGGVPRGTDFAFVDRKEPPPLFLLLLLPETSAVG